ncbi:MAG: hypothetical protein ABII90_09610, partial [Bacteroidota bacterium]
MKVVAKKSFNRDIEKIASVKLARNVKRTIIEIENADNIHQLSNVKKLKGHANAFRIKIGSYRLGFILNNGIIELVAFIHRKDVYRYFP